MRDSPVWGPANFVNCSSGDFIELGSEVGSACALIAFLFLKSGGFCLS